jgi:hypothetical protein
MADDKKVPAPNATRCEAGNNTCGAGQPLFTSGGLVYCEAHSGWPTSKEGRVASATKSINEEK